MTTFGYFLASEEHGPEELVRQARLAEEAGFEALWISDHFHPWLDEQGQSPFVWSVIGALSQAVSLPVTTAVTCPTVRIHPAIVAQAAATSQVMLGGRFRLGLGSGEALNEHVTGAPWPPAAERLEMLEEAIEVIRALFGGRQVSHRGRHYRVDTARLYTLPDAPPPIYLSGFGDRAASLAGRIGDGYWNTAADAELLRVFREAGGEGKPAYGKVDTCVAQDEATARRIAYEIWPTTALAGEIGQQLSTPEHYEQAAASVTEEQVAEGILCSSDPERHVAAIRRYVDAGYDHVHVQQCGQDQDRLLDLYEREVLSALR
jgi:G6PDH family F420-dependent oxidoreductase